MIEILAEATTFNTTSRKLADQARILKKGWFSDFSMVEISEQVIVKNMNKIPQPESKH